MFQGMAFWEISPKLKGSTYDGTTKSGSFSIGFLWFLWKFQNSLLTEHLQLELKKLYGYKKVDANLKRT